MIIDAPIDYQLGEESDTRFCEGRILPELIDNQRRKKRRRGKIFTESYQETPKKKQNYFQKMYNETKKKVYVSMFIRKLKQGIVLKSNFSHSLCDQQSDAYFGAFQTYKWKLGIQAFYLIVLILQTWLSTIAITLQLAFQELQESQQIKIIQYIVILWLLGEIAYKILVKSKFNLKKSKRNVDYISQSFRQYLESGWLTIDCTIIIVFVTSLFTQHQIVHYFKLILIAKITQANQKMKNLQIMFIQNNFKEQYWELIKVFIFNFLFAHFLSIILLILGDKPDSWIHKYSFQSEKWYNIYIWAYYWATNIMLTVGFGDITATSPDQALVLIFIQTLSCIVLAYNINSIGIIIQKITSYEAEKSANLKIFTQMQNDKGVSDDIKKKVTDFIIQSSELKKKFNVTEEQQLLKKLPKNFYQQFKQESNSKIFLDLPFFRNLSHKKIQQISVKIEKKLAHPEEILIQSRTVPKILIFNKGKISLHMKSIGLNSTNREVQSIQAGKDQYKLISQYFLTNKVVNYEVKCKDYSITYSMSHEQLRDILSSHPYSYQYYCMSKDRDRFNPNDLEVQLCELCSNQHQKAYHTLFSCPQLHYQPLKKIVIEKTLRRNPDKIKRIEGSGKLRIKKKMNPLIIFSQLQDMFSYLLQFENQKKNNKNNVNSSKDMLDKILEEDHLDPSSTKLISMKAQLLHKKLESKQSMQIVCREIGEQLRQQILKNSYLVPTNFSQLYDEIPCDIPHNFAFYFQKHNPSKISQNYRKKNLKNAKRN